MTRIVFGIISYFPDGDSEYNKTVRKERIKRCTDLFHKLNELWRGIDVIVIAQNWGDYKLPEISNRVVVFSYTKLGILNARRILREKFLKSGYDYMIMLDDDAKIKCADPAAYIRELENHPDGVGFIRHTNNPFMLCAISKNIYRQIELPNIDMEKGEGYTGDVFVAQCFARFPDKTFDFQPNCIKETSHKDIGYLSTWTVDNSCDWRYMSDITEVLIKALERIKPNTRDSRNDRIDIVLPYVDSQDQVWLAEYNTFIQNYPTFQSRFRSWDTLQYIFRGIETYMSFVGDIILLVSNDSQVPEWVNRNSVRVVYHSEFIPAEYLPTYNSCTIEAFLANIPDLSERFIYFNDDIFPINSMTVDDFFTEDMPHLSFLEHIIDWNAIFGNQCRNGLNMMAEFTGNDRYIKDELVVPQHSAIPMLRSTVQRVYQGCNAEISDTISKLRNMTNINQYVYSYYHFYTGDYIDDACSFIYMEMENRLSDIQRVLFRDEVQLLCLNDCGVSDYEYVRSELHKFFDTKFPNKSKYEK